MNSKAKTAHVSPQSAKKQLVEFYARNGYMRVPDVERRAKEGLTYKMGYEIRLVAQTKKELATMRNLLKLLNIKSGKAYAKKNQWCLPIYGKAAYEQFVEWLAHYEIEA